MPSLPPAFATLRHRDYRWLLTGTLFSTGAQWIQNATLGWVVYDLTGSAALTGSVMGVRAIPLLFLAPLSGLVADRFDRRLALAASQVLPAVASLVVALLLAFGAAEFWHLLVFSLAGSFGFVFERTLRDSLVFDVVPRAEAANGIALNTIAFSAMRTIGPAIAGLLIVHFGPAWNFAIQALTYAGVCASVLLIRPRPPTRRPVPPRGWGAMFAGLRFAATDPSARVIVVVALIPALLLIPSFSALMPVFAAEVFRVGPDGLGMMLSAVGAGGVLGGLLAATLSRYEHVGRLQALATAAFVLCILAFACSSSMLVAIVCLVGAGMAEMVLASSTHASLQMSAPESLRGQVTALLPMFPAFISIGALFAGIGAEILGVQTLVVVNAVLGALVMSLAWSRCASYRAMRMSTLVAGRQ